MKRLLILIFWRISFIFIIFSRFLWMAIRAATERVNEQTDKIINDDDTDSCSALNIFDRSQTTVDEWFSLKKESICGKAILPLALCPFILLHQLISLGFSLFILHIRNDLSRMDVDLSLFSIFKNFKWDWYAFFIA